jgi:hypothetical protein
MEKARENGIMVIAAAYSELSLWPDGTFIGERRTSLSYF